ncbi:hypothetical protein DPMN_093963 [Dreissena polymorpha]|uniref:Uncharacterized protein n=1 Tax=Dreissena polymorpha TaxID=45954 RepID=A0A9D4L4K0_DREPO|nr:hypothetical protein DPMN_093963 [Dreissena polymorpha]
MKWALLSVGAVHIPIPCMSFLVVPMSLVPGLHVMAPKLQGPSVESLVPVSQLEASKLQMPGSQVVGQLIGSVAGGGATGSVAGGGATGSVAGCGATGSVAG